MRSAHSLQAPAAHAGPRPPPQAHRRLAAALAAVTTTVAIGSALLLSFQSASPVLWLAPTPEVMELAERCDRLDNRAQRDRCKQQVVAARLKPEQAAVLLARR